MSVGVELQSSGDSIANVIADKIRGATIVPGGQISVNVVADGKRGGHMNAMIAAVQTAAKRSPWYPSREAIEVIKFLARGAASKDTGTSERALKQIGELLIAEIRKNVTAQANKDGSAFRALTLKYASYKKRKFGFTVPILKATGDLLDNLKVRIERL